MKITTSLFALFDKLHRRDLSECHITRSSNTEIFISKLSETASKPLFYSVHRSQPDQKALNFFTKFNVEST